MLAVTAIRSELDLTFVDMEALHAATHAVSERTVAKAIPLHRFVAVSAIISPAFMRARATIVGFQDSKQRSGSWPPSFRSPAKYRNFSNSFVYIFVIKGN